VRHLPYIIAHRGASATNPENTLLAFQEAISMGAEWIELDVVATRDDVVVVSHDATLDRCTDGSGRIADLTLDEIKQADAGIRFGSRFAGHRIPTLGEAIEIVAGTDLRLCIEVKGDSTSACLRTSRLTVETLQRRSMVHRTVITSYNPVCLATIKEIEPYISLALDPVPQDGTKSPTELCQQVLGCRANFMLHDHRTLSAETIEECHQHGFSLWAWTANAPDAMRRLAAMGVDGIMTDRPNLLVQVLDRFSETTNPEPTA
jgi:glycerophosphoryl diester phosphodiesterase